MLRRINALLITVIMIIIFLSVNVKATDIKKSCNNEDGCLLESYRGIVSNNVFRYEQNDANWKNNKLFYDDGNYCFNSSNIAFDFGNGGCLITASAMVVNYFSNDTITPLNVYHNMNNTCNFSPFIFSYIYSKYLSMEVIENVKFSKQQLINTVSSLINEKQIIIIGARNFKNQTHFIVVDGYMYRDDHYESNKVKRFYSDLNIIDPGIMNRDFSTFIDDFPIIDNIFIFKGN